MSKPAQKHDLAASARRLARRFGRAALGSNMLGAPYASLVLFAADLDASPLLLLSDLAQHSRNIAFDPRISLLIDATEGEADPLNGSRLTLIGQAEPIADARRLARFTAHHPTSAVYSGFADFRLYRITVERAHLVAGFGRIHWIDGGQLLLAGDVDSLAAEESEILRYMNEAQPDVIGDFARYLLNQPDKAWRLAGIDPEGLDLGCSGKSARLDFAAPVFTPEAARAALAELTEKARKTRSR